jgi:hypothetical protein
MTKLIEFLPEFTEALKQQIEEDDKRWGDTWLNRTRKGQEGRIEDDYNNYFDQYRNADVPVPWLKVVGNAMIAWIRENHPEMWEE